MLTEVQSQKESEEKCSVSGASVEDMTNAAAIAPASAGNSKRDFAPLYWLRTERGWSIRDLAAVSGVTPWQIQGYEACLTEPRVGQAFKLALALGVSVDKLFGIPYKKRAREDSDR